MPSLTPSLIRGRDPCGQEGLIGVVLTLFAGEIGSLGGLCSFSGNAKASAHDYAQNRACAFAWVCRVQKLLKGSAGAHNNEDFV